MAILIKGWRIIDPANSVDIIGDILVNDGKIQKIEKTIEDSSAQIIDASNQVVSPGFVDMHAHFRDPWYEYKETIKTWSMSAIAGWITSALAMPNTKPVIDDKTVVEYIISKARKESLINIYVSWCITKWQEWASLADFGTLKDAWIIAITDDWRDVQNLGVYRKAMQYAKTYSLPIISHSEDHDIAKWWVLNEGAISTRLWLAWIPSSAEDVATARIICLVNDVRNPVHFTHVSSKWSVELIEFALNKWLPVTADTTPHHFSLTDEACLGFNTNAKMNPPLRNEEHRMAIIEWLQKWIITCIATDHAPHSQAEKEKDFEYAPFWIVWFETMLPLIITNLVNKGYIDLKTALACITCNPAKILWIPKWTLWIGCDADITIFDPAKSFIVDKTKFRSKSNNTPFDGMKLSWVVTKVLVWGELRFSV